MRYPLGVVLNYRSWLGVLWCALWLSSGLASALGLGEIRVISRPGEPLIAQIPIVSNALGELDQAHVVLAGDDVYQRVGLELPDALTRSLQFTFAKDAQDHALIWVTSKTPINQRSVNFLLALDWPQGRLVREYTALVDTPTTLASQESSPPVIEGPDAGINRSTAISTIQPATAVTKDPLAQAQQAIGEVHAPPPIPVPTPPDAAVGGAIAPPATPPTGAIPPAAGTPLVTVEKGQTLSEIALDVAESSQVTLNQAMLALLHANPKSFIHGNVNALKQGAILRAPSQKDFRRYSVAQARAVIRQQINQWRLARAPLPQPTSDGRTQVNDRRSVQSPSSPEAAVQDRLKIAPAATTQPLANQGALSGTRPSGEGDMQDSGQLQQAREDLASRQIEIQELRSRIDELERLKQKQDHLLQLKDSALAEANLQLAKKTPQPPDRQSHQVWLTVVEVAVLGVIVALVAWLFMRRAHRFNSNLVTSQPRSFFPQSASLDKNEESTKTKTDGVNASGGMSNDWVAATSLKAGQPSAKAVGRFGFFKRLFYGRARWDPAKPIARGLPSEVPGWAASSSQWMASTSKWASQSSAGLEAARSDQEAARQGAIHKATATGPADHVDAGSHALHDPRERDNDSGKVRDRLELARAFLELGDRSAAKTLLNEVMSSDDQKVRTEAIELSKQLPSSS